MRRTGTGILFCALALGSTIGEPCPAAGQGTPVSPSTQPAERGRLERSSLGFARPRDRSGENFLTNDQIDRLMMLAKESFPQLYEILASARENNPRLFQQKIVKVSRYAIPILKAKADNPELAEKMIAEQRAQMAIDELTRQYRATTKPARRDQLRIQIREQLEAKFDARLEKIRIEIRSLQRRLDDAKEHLAQQERNKQKLLDETTSNLTGRKGL